MLKLLIALAVAMAMPVSQLHTVSVIAACCCPDPDHCHCPDHHGSQGDQSSMRACHRTSHVVVAPVLPVFVAPAAVVALAPVRMAVRPSYALAVPHAAPAPRRPAAPS